MDASFSSISSTWSSEAWSSQSHAWSPSSDLRSPGSDVSSPGPMSPVEPPGYLTPVEDAEQACALLSAASQKLRPFASDDPEVARLVYLLQLVQQQLAESPCSCTLDEELSVNLPALLHSITRNFTPRLHNVSRFKKFLAATGIAEALEEYALYLASARLAPDRAAFETHAARYKPPRGLSPSSSVSSSPRAGRGPHVTFQSRESSLRSRDGVSYEADHDAYHTDPARREERGANEQRRKNDLAFPYRELSVKMRPGESGYQPVHRRVSVRRRRESVDSYMTPGLEELYVDPDWF